MDYRGNSERGQRQNKRGGEKSKHSSRGEKCRVRKMESAVYTVGEGMSGSVGLGN